MSLSGQQRKKLAIALIDAFPTTASLEQMLAYELDKSLTAIAGEGNSQEIVFKLIQTANSQEWVEDLVRAARGSNSGNPLLIDIAEELFPIKSPEPHFEIENLIPEPATSIYTKRKTAGNNLDHSYPVMELEYPDGYVPLNSHFYREQDGIESVYETLLKPASLIRIKAPKLMGKTSLMMRIIDYGEKQSFQSVYLDLGGTDKSILTNLDKFLRWFCGRVSDELNLDNKVSEVWNPDMLGSNDNCTAYFKKYILAKINQHVVLGLDEVDRLFTYSEVVEDFFGMLRSWHEKGKISDVWKQLRLVLAYSTEVYIPLDIHQSPFNAGLPVELEEFNQQQTKELVKKHGIQDADTVVKELSTMVGGHPYLLRLAMYEIATGKVTLNNLLQSATTEAGIYNNHLRSLLGVLQTSPELQSCLKRVVNSNVGVELEPMQIYKLHSLGLVQKQNNYVTPRCQLYREYFRRVL